MKKTLLSDPALLPQTFLFQQQIRLSILQSFGQIIILFQGRPSAIKPEIHVIHQEKQGLSTGNDWIKYMAFRSEAFQLFCCQCWL